MPTRNIVLTDHQAEFVDRLVGSGQYQDESEVLRHGLRLVEQRNAADEAKLAALRAAVQVGIDDIEAGRLIELDDDEAITEFVQGLLKEALAKSEG